MKMRKLAAVMLICLVFFSCGVPVENATNLETTATGDFWLPAEYDYIYIYPSGYGILEQAGRYWIITPDNDIIPWDEGYEIAHIGEGLVCVKSKSSGKYGLADMDGRVLIQPQYDESLEFSDGLACVSRDGNIGFIDTENRLVIDYNYEWGMPFADGRAAVGIGEQFEQFWFIDTQGEIVCGPFEFLNMEVFTFTPAYMEYSEGYTAYFEKDDSVEPYGRNGEGGYWGYLDKDGRVAVQAEYLSVRPFKEGLAAVQTREQDWVYIDKNGDRVMKGAACDFSEGLAYNGDGFMDASGQLLVTLPDGYEVNIGVPDGAENFKFGYVAVSGQAQDGLTWGIMNTEGEIVIESPDFEDIQVFNSHLAAVRIGDKWGMVKI